MKKNSRFIFLYLLLGLLAFFLVRARLGEKEYLLAYSEFKQHISQGHVLQVEIGQQVAGKMLIPEGKEKEVPRPAILGQKPMDLPVAKEFRFRADRVEDPDLAKDLAAHNIPYTGKTESDPSLYITILMVLGLIAAFLFLMMRQSGQGARAALMFGRSKARLYAEKVKTVTFDDVAGCEEAKEELREVVDFLRSPKKYQTLGGRMPKGVLLVGPPGTGKTLIARAVAGEAKAPFFSLSGSEFVEMFVGVGAARVRDLFQQAKDSAPCIIFVDELDAVGRHRGAGLGGGHDEREQTLNQLLVEMDGFDANTGVIILAATNRPDVLDPALLRPGRFDRQVVIDAPDAKGREAILKVHARGKPVDGTVDLSLIAGATPGFTGADLANVMNEAALLAARRTLTKITKSEIDEAVERAIAGPERKSRRLGEEERRRVAYHEAGHALVAALSKHADPVRKISIIPRGHAALGYTMQFPTDDRYLITRSALLDQLKSLLAGRAAEELVFKELSTGAQNDLSRASEIARHMVCRFGMSEELGPVSFGREDHQVFLGRDLAHEERNYSESSAVEIDREVRRIIDDSNEEARAILAQHRPTLEHIAETLLEREVLQGSELDEILRKELGDVVVPRREKSEVPVLPATPVDGDGSMPAPATPAVTPQG
jgi:cell division protease FtsH